MIPKIILGKGPRATHRTIGYLFGPGRANEHVDPHVVASWNGFAPDPGRTPHRDPRDVATQLAAQLDQPVRMLGDAAPVHTVWHCPVRTAPEDPVLTDEQWGEIARRIVAAAGIAPQGDEEACRWVAVRHAEDHIHIAATLVRQDGRRPARDHDKRAVQREARKIEADYGLRRLNPGDGTAAKRHTSKEHFKARRQGASTTTRQVLRLRVRRAMAAASDEAEFFSLLEATEVIVRLKRGPSGDAMGCNFALRGDTNDAGDPVFYSGSTLAPDLSLPKIRQSLETPAAGAPVAVRAGDPWHQAIAAVERVPHHLAHGDEHLAQGQLVALGASLDLLATIAPADTRADLTHAATAFERATRSRITADLHSARVLRRSVQAIWRERPPDRDGAAFAMLLDATLTAVAFALHWHRTHQHAQQEAATKHALPHMQSAYSRATDTALNHLAGRTPPPQTRRRLAQHVAHAVPEHADRILHDPAWDALATALAEAEATGHSATALLDQALGQRSLANTRSPARVLTWRVHRLGARTAPSPRAQAAMARSTVRGPVRGAQPIPAATNPLPGPTTPVRRR